MSRTVRICTNGECGGQCHRCQLLAANRTNGALREALCDCEAALKRAMEVLEVGVLLGIPVEDVEPTRVRLIRDLVEGAAEAARKALAGATAGR